MPDYRFYIIELDGHVGRPPVIVDCADDRAAIEEAKRQLGGHVVEVWQEKRKITRIEADGTSR